MGCGLFHPALADTTTVAPSPSLRTHMTLTGRTLMTLSRTTSSMMCLCRSLMLPDKNLASQPSGLQQNSPTGAGAKVSLELTRSAA